MKSKSLENKTVRPGLMNYSFYSSSRRPVSRAKTTKKSSRQSGATRHHFWPIIVSLAVLAGLLIGFKSVQSQAKQPVKTNGVIAATTTPSTTSSTAKPVTPVTAAPAATSSHCSGNSLSQLIKVSITQRHLWACQNYKVVYDTPVVTGMENYEADKTPVGTYKIYAKRTNLTLTGSDSTGSWNDPVSYWMPFLDNQFGIYGFHDATWRSDNDFGNIDPNTDQASHGCVELPLGASKWLYDWASVGTTVTIQS